MKLSALHVPGSVERWTALGFSAAGHRIGLVNGAIEVGHPSVALAVEPADPHGSALPLDVEGIQFVAGDSNDDGEVDHPNGAFELDHVVILTPDLDHMSAAIERATGLSQRRLRETAEVRQAFHRFDRTTEGAPGCIIEIVERPGSAKGSIWGVVVNVDDLDGFAASSELVGEPRDAVQPGRRIATVHRRAGIGLALAFMSPGP